MNQRGDYRGLAILAEIYDQLPEYGARSDAAFYLEFCRSTDGPVLELGCGTGRVLLPIARAGKQITGIDHSEHMLAKCREKLELEPPEIQAKVSLLQSDVADFDLGQQFAAVTMPFRVFQMLLTVERQMACLAAIRRHLRPDGKLVVDCFNPDFKMLSLPTPTEEVMHESSFTVDQGRTVRWGWRVVADHRAAQYRDVELIYHLTDEAGQKERVTHFLQMRYIFRYEIEHLLVRCGFNVDAVYGNFDKSEFRDDSPEIVVVASLA